MFHKNELSNISRTFAMEQQQILLYRFYGRDLSVCETKYRYNFLSKVIDHEHQLMIMIAGKSNGTLAIGSASRNGAKRSQESVSLRHEPRQNRNPAEG